MSRHGALLGTLGVAAFGLTLPFTRIAVVATSPLEVFAVRLLLASALAALVCAVTRTPLPRGGTLRDVLIVAAGIVIGFPLFTSLAMASEAAGRGGVVLGVLPLATSVAGAVLNRERPSRCFWLAALAGALLVVLFALVTGPAARAGPSAADGWLLAAIGSAAVGYALGGRLAGRMPAWRVISLALALSLPAALALPWLVGSGPSRALRLLAGTEAGPAVALSLLYLGLVSQYGGFLLWYRAIAIDGVARTAQLQLAQPFLTLAGAALLLGERITPVAVAFASAIALTVFLSRRAAVRVAASNEAATRPVSPSART